jgi:hypothetical protein
MTVYLFHLSTPLPRGKSQRGTELKAGHYIGFCNDLVGRILEHADSIWEPFEQPITLEDGRRCNGKRRGNGSTFLAVCNARGIGYELVRTWEGEGANRAFERKLKNQKKAGDLCPICNPAGWMKRARLEA